MLLVVLVVVVVVLVVELVLVIVVLVVLVVVVFVVVKTLRYLISSDSSWLSRYAASNSSWLSSENFFLPNFVENCRTEPLGADLVDWHAYFSMAWFKLNWLK